MPHSQYFVYFTETNVLLSSYLVICWRWRSVGSRGW